MSTTTAVRRLSLQSLTLTPLVAAALVAGTVSAPPAASGAAPARSGQAAPAVAGPSSGAPVNIRTKPVYYRTPDYIAIPRRATAARLASYQKGKPYRWGAAGPTAFDCSGLVYYVYVKRLGVSLPRTANAQRLSTIYMAKWTKRPGDLIFFMSNGRAYHVGIYAGNNKVWHAPRPGQRVQLSTIWTSAYRVGRIR